MTQYRPLIGRPLLHLVDFCPGFTFEQLIPVEVGDSLQRAVMSTVSVAIRTNAFFSSAFNRPL